MSGRHASTLVRLFDCWKSKDLEGALELVAETVVFEPDLKGSRYEGREALRGLWEKYMQMMKSYDYEIVSIIEQDDVIVIERLEVVGASSGPALRLPIAGVFRMDTKGKIIHWRDYWDTSMASPH